MGLLGTAFHSLKGAYNWLCDDYDAANHEFDAAVDSLHKTMILDPIGITDIPDIIDGVTGDD